MFAHLACGVEPWFEPRGFWRAFKDYDGQPVNIRWVGVARGMQPCVGLTSLTVAAAVAAAVVQ